MQSKPLFADFQGATLTSGDIDTQVNEANRVKTCFHCLETVPSYANISAVVNGKEQPMCCIGCKAAAEFIEQRGLSRFYQHRERLQYSDFFGQIATRESDEMLTGSNTDKWCFIDTDEQSDYVNIGRDGRHLEIQLEGLYCASCSWLISRAVRSVSPSAICHVDIDHRTLGLTVSDPQLKLSIVLQTIEQLGYRVRPLRADAGTDRAATHKAERGAAVRRVVIAGLGAMQVMTYAVATYFGGTSTIIDGALMVDLESMIAEQHRFFMLLSMLVATLVVFYSGKPFFVNALNDIQNRRLGMDVPVAIAIAGAYFPSVYQVLSKSAGHVYFDSAVMFVFFLSLGRYIEMQARHKISGAGDDVQTLLPERVVVQRGEPQVATTITPKGVQVGDQMTVERGDIVPFDGRIVKGNIMVNESLLSGEPLALERSDGEHILAGCEVKHGSALIVAKHCWADSSLARIQSMLGAANSMSETETGLATWFGRYFVVFTLCLTALVASVWLVINPERVFEVSLAMLIASCPCAFSLAAPIGRSAAIYALKRMGVLLTTGAVLSRVRQIDTWLFDKTGTLSKGSPGISNVTIAPGQSRHYCLSLIAAIERHSGHVLAGAFSTIETDIEIHRVQERAGSGIEAIVDDQVYYLGKPGWVASHLRDTEQASAKKIFKQASSLQAGTQVALVGDGRLMAILTLEDEVRSSAEGALFDLTRTPGVNVEVLSGDNTAAVASCCAKLGLVMYKANKSPEDKFQRMQELRDSGRKVVMVGDGVNDAPVLAAADLSIALANGCDLSLNNADVILLNGNLARINNLRDVAVFTEVITRQNVSWALAYNALVLPLAAFGFLNPWLAALGMSCSSLLVVLNSLRIRSKALHAAGI